MAQTKTNKRFLELPLNPSDVNLSASQLIDNIDTQLGTTDWKSQKTEEEIQDILGAAITDGVQTNITVTYNDSTGVIDFNVVGGGGGGLTQEEVEDIVNALILTSSDLDTAYDDGNGTLTISLSAATASKVANLPTDQGATNTTLQSNIDGKEDDLGNPASNGQILSSQTDGTRSWIDPATGNVTSVNSQTGAVVLDSDDITEGATNLYYPSADASKVANLPADQEAINSDIETRVSDNETNKQDNISITTVGTTGAASLNGNVINVPQYDLGGSGDNIIINSTYTDLGGGGLVGLINGSNDTFIVSQGEYAPGTLVVYVEGIAHTAGAGLSETTPGSGIFTMTTAPETGTQTVANYNVGVTNVSGPGLPVGGTAGQVLAKIDGTDYNTEWVNQTGGGGGSSETAEFLVPTAQNTLPNLSQAPTNLVTVRTLVNQLMVDNLAGSGISVDNAGVITVNSTDLGYNIETTTRVVVYYTI